MYRYALTFLALFSLFSATDCGEDCFPFPDGGELEVSLENQAAATYARGDTLWVTADFSAQLNDGGVSISEGGGLFVSQMFRIGADSSSVVAALSAFTPVVSRGALVPAAENNDPAAAILRYTCPAGRCGFRQGFRLDSVGQFLLRVNGSGYDATEDRLSPCASSAFGSTVLDAPSNLSGVPFNFPLRYPRDQFSFVSDIDTFFQRNLLFFAVE
jgi:hypothetical protein